MVDVLALVAGLARGEEPVGLHDEGAVPLGLVADLPEEFSDGGVPDGLGLMPQFIHARHIQRLDAEHLVLPDQQSADLVMQVFAQAQDFAPDGVDPVLGFVPAAGTLLSAGLYFLPARELLQVLVERFRVEVVVQFGIYCQGLDADVGGACCVGFDLGAFGRPPVVEAEFPPAQVFSDDRLVGYAPREVSLELYRAQVGEPHSPVPVVLDSVYAGGG